MSSVRNRTVFQGSLHPDLTRHDGFVNLLSVLAALVSQTLRRPSSSCVANQVGSGGHTEANRITIPLSGAPKGRDI